MMPRLRLVTLVLCVAALASATLASGCRRAAPAEAPVATPSVRVNHPRAAAGSPLELTYTFVVGNDAKMSGDYRVMLHVVDTDDELMWTDDHNPPTPTSAWKPGEKVEYTRTIFVPVFPYVGNATLQVGLYSTADQRRLPLAGEDVGQRAYKVGTVDLLPQTENLLTMFKDGWHPAETAGPNATVEWQWTKKDATLAFKNPRKDSIFYLEVDSPVAELHGPQQVQVKLGGQPLDQFTLVPNEIQLRKVKLSAAQLGAGEMAELQISVDPTFVPATVNPSISKDPRELGVRVFHAFVDPR
jgi:hypothetical protein